MKKRFSLVLLGLLALGIALIAGCAGASSNSTQPGLESKKLLDGRITINPDTATAGKRTNYYDVKFTVTSAMVNPSAQGTIHTSGGGGLNDAVGYLFDDASFRNWVDRNEGVTTLYDSGYAFFASMNVSLVTPGIYHLVFYNTIGYGPEGIVMNRQAIVAAKINLSWNQ